MSQIEYFHRFKPLKRVTKTLAFYTFVLLHMCFKSNFTSGETTTGFRGGIVGDCDVDAYFGVSNINNARIIFFFVQINTLEAYSANIGNAYLHFFAKEKIYIMENLEI